MEAWRCFVFFRTSNFLTWSGLFIEVVVVSRVAEWYTHTGAAPGSSQAAVARSRAQRSGAGRHAARPRDRERAALARVPPGDSFGPTLSYRRGGDGHRGSAS